MKKPVTDHPGMISSDEEKLIKSIVLDSYLNNSSCFIEIGPWLGKSTYCILDAIENIYLPKNSGPPLLACYDRFIWSEMYARSVQNYSSFSSFYELDKLREGESFQSNFEKIIENHPSKILVTSSIREVSEISLDDFISFSSSRDISAFFIDASKN